MKGAIRYLIIILFIKGTAFCQHGPTPFGEISIKDLTMDEWSTDPSASALILFDKGDATINYSSERQLTYKRHRRIKIFKKAAFDLADIEIYAGTYTISKISAATYNIENGKVVESKVDRKDIHSVQLDKYRESVNFAFPNVREGSIIEYSYTLGSSRAWIPSWQFQSEAPTLWSEYNVTAPIDSRYKVDIHGPLQITIEESKYNGIDRRWVIKNAPAFVKEHNMPDLSEVISGIRFYSSFDDWLKVRDYLLTAEPYFANVVQQSTTWKEKVRDLTAGTTSERAKMLAIINFLKQTIEWYGTKDWSGSNPDDLWTAKKGSSGDINVLLAGMLNSANIKTDMVILSTRENGRINQSIPSLQQFDYVVCRAYCDSTYFLLDATNKYLPFDFLPDYCLNRIGLLISNDTFGWIQIPEKNKAKTMVTTDVEIDSAGLAQAKITTQHYGYTAAESREVYFKEGKSAFLKSIFSEKDIQCDDVQISEPDGSTNPLKTVINARVENHGLVNGDLTYINPFLALLHQENPFNADSRLYPIILETPLEEIYLYNLKIPDGYTVEELPESKIFAMSGNSGKYVFNVSQTENQITILSNLQINKTEFAKEDYATLKVFYTVVMEKQSEQIVLKKQ